MTFAYCPDCGMRVYVGRRVWRGQLVACDSCDADLEVTSTNPVELDWPEESSGDEEWLGTWQADLEQVEDSLAA